MFMCYSLNKNHANEHYKCGDGIISIGCSVLGPSPKRSKRAFDVENNRNQTVCMCVIWNNKFESSLTDVQPIWLSVVMVCVWVLFVFLHLISVTLVLRLILWWFCDRIYKCGGFFLSLLERVSHAKRAVEAVRWSCKRLLRWWWSKICVCIFIVCHGERSDATTMPTKAVVDGCEKC